MRKSLLFLSCLFFLNFNSKGQINYTANDQVATYNGHFRLGSNMGAYSNWEDIDLANIAAGNPSLGIKGAGIRSLRPALPEKFLEFWGYDIRESTFQHYASLDINDNAVFIGYPSDEHKNPEYYCPDHQSQVFANMYTDIWDGGANGTPVNDENYYALYLYKMVSVYKDQVKFWEIWNEPDFDFSGNGWKPEGQEGNWFENVPEPCDYQLRSPIFHYIRMLRISYEVIKYVDPSAYVAVGGLGFPSFLDLLLRHSDNPDEGVVSADFPNRGGAYFDVLSYHSYPHFDGSLRYWSNDVGGFVHTRHSDAAAEGVVNKKSEFQEVLNEYGYDGNTYPEKLWIITESNIPRLPFQDYIGSAHAQRNFLLKTIVGCQKANILQYHLYIIADGETEANASNEFQVMGLYKKLEGTATYQQQTNSIAIAARTATQLIYQHTFDAAETQKMQLPAAIGGGALRAPNGEYTYVLWAKTDTDRSEGASANYSFPANMGIDWVEKRKWNFSESALMVIKDATGFNLDADPVFLKKSIIPTATIEPTEQSAFTIFPNPGQERIFIDFKIEKAQTIKIDLIDSKGSTVKSLSPKQEWPAGNHSLSIPVTQLPKGIYAIRFTKNGFTQTQKWVKI